jgi:integrase
VERRGPTLHAYAIAWPDRYAGSGRDSVRENTRREYRRLLSTFTLRYFERGVRVRDLDRAAIQGFVDRLTSLPGRNGRLCDRSVANALTPLRAALGAAVAEGLLEQNPADGVVLPWRRGGRAFEFKERRFLTREQLAGVLKGVHAEVAAALRGARRDRAADLRGDRAALERSRARIGLAATAGQPRDRPRCRGCAEVARLVPLPPDLAATLRAAAAAGGRRRRARLSGARGRPRGRGEPPPPGASARSRAGGPLRRRVSHPATHLCLATNRVGVERPAPLALDGPPLAGVHARDLRTLIDGDVGAALYLHQELPSAR